MPSNTTVPAGVVALGGALATFPGSKGASQAALATTRRGARPSLPDRARIAALLAP